MAKKGRDFYHVQDQILLGWGYVKDSLWVSPEIARLSDRISELQESLAPMNATVRELFDLTNQKFKLYEKALSQMSATYDPVSPSSTLTREKVEVSLSSSGLGFFSKTSAEEDAVIELLLTLDTLKQEVRMEATVLESRLSADSENPGYWVRVRFSRGQDENIDKLVAHVTQRQIDKLEK